MLTLIAIVAAAIAVAIVANWKLQFFRWDLLDEIKRMSTSTKSMAAEPESSTVSASVEAAQPVKPSEPVTEPVKPEAQPRRARDGKGKFVGDKPETPAVNEAWVGGQAPTKKVSTRRRRGSVKK